MEIKNKLHIILYLVKEFNGSIEQPEQNGAQDNQHDQHHIITIKVNTVRAR